MKKKILKFIKKKIKLIKIFFLYSTNISLYTNNNKKEIIIIFDGNISHGGLVDRLKGIVSFYAIAKQTNARFKIYFTSPFNLECFLVPNQFNWIADKNDLKWNPFKSKFLLLNDNFNFNWKKSIQKTKKNKIFVYANIDYLPTIFNEKIEDQWLESFWELFKISDFLNEKIKLEILPQNYISIHTRFTSLLGDFKDTANKKVSNDRKNQIFDQIKRAIKIIENQNSNIPVIVFSDSIIFLDFIKSNTNYIVLAGKPNHIDINNDKTIDSNMKTFLDFFILSKSEAIYLVRTNDMYNSAFSKYAAIAGNTKFNSIVLDND